VAGRAPVPPRIALGVTLPSRVQQGQVGSYAAKPFGSPGRGALPRPILLQPGPALGRQQTGDRQVNALQEAQRVATSVAKASPIGNGNLIENVTLLSGTTLVAHGLGRAFRSCVLCGISTANLWNIQRPSGIPQDLTYVSITVASNMIADVLVW
jgi:hypothetical protein